MVRGICVAAYPSQQSTPMSADRSSEVKLLPRTPKLSDSIDGADHQHSTPRTDHSGNSSNKNTREVRNVLSSELSGKVFEGVPIDNFLKIFLNSSGNF